METGRGGDDQPNKRGLKKEKKIVPIMKENTDSDEITGDQKSSIGRVLLIKPSLLIY